MSNIHFKPSLTEVLKDRNLTTVFDDFEQESMSVHNCRSSHGDEYGRSSCHLCGTTIYGTNVEFHEIHHHPCIHFLNQKLCVCDQHAKLSEKDFINLLRTVKSRCGDPNECLLTRLVIWYFQKLLERDFPKDSWEIAELISTHLVI
jgi:hypothetical protein